MIELWHYDKRKIDMRRAQAQHELAKDLVLILIGIFVALVLLKVGALDAVLTFFGDGIIASFITGIFFTSAFTVAPASVALAHIGETTTHLTVALWGALGALCGDLILFFFIRDRFADDVIHAFKPSLVKHIIRSLHFGFLKWLSPVIGALIIASPLPDEFGIALMGMSKIRLAVLIPVAFIMNMLGIYIILWFASFL